MHPTQLALWEDSFAWDGNLVLRMTIIEVASQVPLHCRRAHAARIGAVPRVPIWTDGPSAIRARRPLDLWLLGQDQRLTDIVLCLEMGPQRTCAHLESTMIVFDPILLPMSVVAQAFAGVGVDVLQKPRLNLPWHTYHSFGLVSVRDKTNLFE